MRVGSHGWSSQARTEARTRDPDRYRTIRKMLTPANASALRSRKLPYAAPPSSDAGTTSHEGTSSHAPAQNATEAASMPASVSA